MTDVWGLFPYPTLREEPSHLLIDGALISTPEVCATCPSRECVEKSRGEEPTLSECRYGINYMRIDEGRLIVGVVATDAPTLTKRARRRARQAPSMRVKAADLRSSVDRARALGPGVVADWKRSRDEILEKLQDDPAMFAALAERLRQDFAETLTQSHDFLQLVKLVRGYSESLLLEKHPGISPEDAAERSPAEGAIFFATELMLVKMDALVFLNEINRAFGSEARIRIHPYLLKYVRIYSWQAEQKNLTIQLVGNCFASAWYNANAIGAVFQGLLDNLVKYAPAGSKAVVHFDDQEDEVILRFVSLGPRIERAELNKIFLPGFRAAAARATASDGLGVGLATAKSISDALHLDLHVEQAAVADEKYAARFETTFSLRMRKLNASS